MRNADLLVEVFGSEEKAKVPGHQIVETGLIKLFQLTGKQAYLDLSRHFLDNRGDSTKRPLWGAYCQDHKPVIKQDEAVGHAVRAAYMYAGMTDIAALCHDEAYARAVSKIWQNTVEKKMYITGGIGSRHEGEAFGENYELPNLTSYNETCAAIANVYWNHRMFLLHGEAKYIDVLERSLYNGVLSGVSLDGRAFFYPNPLSCDMHYRFNRHHLERQPWFDCSCCPTNLCRFMPSIPGYIYAQKENDLYVNLFVKSSTNVELSGVNVKLEQTTNYPWSGDVRIVVSPDKKAEFNLRVRLPGWSLNRPLPGDLYAYVNASEAEPQLFINGENLDYNMESGYALIARQWKEGDVVTLSLPMPVRTVKSNDLVATNRNKLVIERGPLVYCVEEVDNPKIEQVSISGKTQFASSYEAALLNGVEVITASGSTDAENFTAIPYHVWNNRGANKMDVWIKAE